MKGRFKDKVVIITGASSGIGEATAKAFAREGAQTVLSDVDEERGKKVMKDIVAANGEAVFLPCDVSSAADNERLVKETVKEYGKLHFAFNNAGISGDSAATADMSIENWDKVIAINLSGVFYGMKYQVPEIIRGGGGAIVNNSSILGFVGFQNAAAYVAAKHGVNGLTKNAAMEYAAQGVRINAVNPGFIETPMLEDAGLMEDQEMYNMLKQMHPIGRLGKPEEVANVVLFLCSEEASFIVGTPVLVDGGYVAR